LAVRPDENEFSGMNTGNVVQAGSISGGVHLHQSIPGISTASKQRLASALHALTFPVTPVLSQFVESPDTPTEVVLSCAWQLRELGRRGDRGRA
jgi:hypothetical protein